MNRFLVRLAFFVCLATRSIFADDDQDLQGGRRSLSWRVETAPIYGSPIKDQRGHLWGRSSARGESIREWDGEDWQAYAIPAHSDVIGPLLLDNHGRIWVNAYDLVFIFDPAPKEWRTEKGMHAALEHELAADPAFTLFENDAWHGAFSGDGRVSFRDDTGVTLEYYDGKTWRKWTSGAISFALPQFDKGELWACNQESRWHFVGTDWVPETPKPSPTPVKIDPQTPTVKIEGRMWVFDSLPLDESGSAWLTVENRLYRARRGLTLPMFGDDERNPFRDGRSVRKVVYDLKGGVFIDTDVWGECVLLKPSAPPPATHLETSQEEDKLRIKLSASGVGKHWFEWRLDGGEWSAVTAAQTITLDFLSNGKHRLETRALDELLQTDPIGARKEFVVTVDREKRFSEAMRRLRSKDLSEREKAVRALVHERVQALPALRELEKTATPDEKWWIEAAIQEIERSTSQRPPP